MTTLDATIVVATYGDLSWRDLAEQRAVPSARQFEVPVVAVHRDSLHAARNAGLAEVATEWVVFLDADDELDVAYLRHLARASADVRVPSVAHVTPRAPRGRPKLPQVAGHRHGCVAECLPEGNWCVIGSAARADQVRAVGGFRDWPVYEDWDLWLRMFLAGATFEAVPGAIYRAYVRPESRNRSGDPADRVATHWAIHASIYGEATA